MDLILAIDLKGGFVVHGSRGERDSYRPLTWGLASSADPQSFIAELSPRYLYIADLDRIEGTGSHNDQIALCAELVEKCYIDRGCRSPGDYLAISNVINVVGTETGGKDLEQYHGGFLSIDIMDCAVIPSGADPASFIRGIEGLHFDGCIILSISSVGTGHGVKHAWLREMRNEFEGTLLYGGGVATIDDLLWLADAGFDGVIVSTAVHRKRVPLWMIQEGTLC